MQSNGESVNLPAVRLVPDRDNDLIEWLADLRAEGVNVSSRIRKMIRQSIDQDYEIASRLARIEGILQQGIHGDAVQAVEESTQKYNDPFLDSGL